MNDKKQMTIRFIERETGFLWWKKKFIVVQKLVDVYEAFDFDGTMIAYHHLLGRGSSEYWVDVQTVDLMQHAIKEMKPTSVGVADD